ncbi:collagen alpha-1(I) chain-like [Panthera uncia]|uniref:collagen alpha-1(I) chain-like n=1 Tax=Panthera uncia TaxID=29064 RepID=UPI0020FFDB79|nr:collagen alpha-1(I) chain-like [Panthera uncia]
MAKCCVGCGGRAPEGLPALTQPWARRPGCRREAVPCTELGAAAASADTSAPSREGAGGRVRAVGTVLTRAADRAPAEEHRGWLPSAQRDSRPNRATSLGLGPGTGGEEGVTAGPRYFGEPEAGWGGCGRQRHLQLAGVLGSRVPRIASRRVRRTSGPPASSCPGGQCGCGGGCRGEEGGCPAAGTGQEGPPGPEVLLCIPPTKTTARARHSQRAEEGETRALTRTPERAVVGAAVGDEVPRGARGIPCPPGLWDKPLAALTVHIPESDPRACLPGRQEGTVLGELVHASDHTLPFLPCLACDGEDFEAARPRGAAPRPDSDPTGAGGDAHWRTLGVGGLGKRGREAVPAVLQGVLASGSNREAQTGRLGSGSPALQDLRRQKGRNPRPCGMHTPPGKSQDGVALDGGHRPQSPQPEGSLGGGRVTVQATPHGNAQAFRRLRPRPSWELPQPVVTPDSAGPRGPCPSPMLTLRHQVWGENQSPAVQSQTFAPQRTSPCQPAICTGRPLRGPCTRLAVLGAPASQQQRQPLGPLPAPSRRARGRPAFPSRADSGGPLAESCEVPALGKLPAALEPTSALGAWNKRASRKGGPQLPLHLVGRGHDSELQPDPGGRYIEGDERLPRNLLRAESPQQGLLGEASPVDTGPIDAGPVDAGTVDTVPVDAGPVDTGPVDAGPVDAGPMDAGPVDAGPVDAGPMDTGPVDAGPVDAGPVDVGPMDAGPIDAGPMDTGPVDTDPVDAGPVDAGPVDTGPVDAGPVDVGPIDTGPVDSGPVDTGPVDAGPVDSGPVDSGPVDSGPSGRRPCGRRACGRRACTPTALQEAERQAQDRLPVSLLAQALASGNRCLRAFSRDRLDRGRGHVDTTLRRPTWTPVARACCQSFLWGLCVVPTGNRGVVIQGPKGAFVGGSGKASKPPLAEAEKVLGTREEQRVGPGPGSCQRPPPGGNPWGGHAGQLAALKPDLRVRPPAPVTVLRPRSCGSPPSGAPGSQGSKQGKFILSGGQWSEIESLSAMPPGESGGGRFLSLPGLVVPEPLAFDHVSPVSVSVISWLLCGVCSVLSEDDGPTRASSSRTTPSELVTPASP